ncbi:MAG TPA: peptidase S41 [Desulfotomaculum sp.]|nr:MAG: Carboxyl-terminal protease [Desulfotomaculum sp. 46_80]HAG11787.1 peptidase S41 [Desulfotomaculum sp.]HBY03827.1 peptidase S41 [Desulfotomaculum sp.]
MNRSFQNNDNENWLTRGLVIFSFLILFFTAGAVAVIVTNYNHMGNLFKVISLVGSRYLEPVKTTTLVDGAIRGLVDSLDDPYSAYLEPDVLSKILQEQIKGTIEGLGILVGTKDGYLVVVRSYTGTPARKKGIIEGDIILKIGDRDTKNMDLETAVGLIKGPVNTKVKLTIKRAGVFDEQLFEITREKINVPTADGYLLPQTKIGYISIEQFTEGTPQEVKNILELLKKQDMNGIILDLRDNPGGELRSTVKVAEYFVPKGPVVYIDYRFGKDETFSVEGHNLKMSTVVLVNKMSASAAEILAGAIKDRKAGLLVGEKTFGKGIVQEIFTLGGGAGVKLTTARYLTPAKNDINKKGIVPDVYVEHSSKYVGKDTQLQKAVEVLEKMTKEAA